MLPEIVVRNGLLAKPYLLTHRFYDADPLLVREPFIGKEALLTPPFTRHFYWACNDDINYPNHHWDLLRKFGEMAARDYIPDWFDKDDVINALIDLTVAEHIKVWELIEPERINN